MNEDQSITTMPASGGEIQTVEASTRAMAEVQAAAIMAKKFPRNQVQAIDRIRAACARPGLAGSALYSYARGGTEITGPSIRLAECMAQAWGNLQFGIREVEQRSGESTVEAFCWDLETNTRQTKLFQVRHERHTKQGARRLEDPRDIYELVANQGARRLRACILGIIPGDVVEDAVGCCEQTLQAKAEATPERIAKLLEAFAGMGVTRRQIEARIQRHVDSLTPSLMIQLGKIFTSMRDGMSSAADWFPPDQDQAAGAAPKTTTAAGVVAALKRKGSRAAQDGPDGQVGQSAKDGADGGQAGTGVGASEGKPADDQVAGGGQA